MNQKTPPQTEPKKYSFTKQEFLQISEYRAVMELYDSLIRRFVAAVVLDRLKIDSSKKFIRVSDDGNGIEVYDVPQAQDIQPQPSPATPPPAAADTKSPPSKKSGK